LRIKAFSNPVRLDWVNCVFAFRCKTQTRHKSPSIASIFSSGELVDSGIWRRWFSLSSLAAGPNDYCCSRRRCLPPCQRLIGCFLWRLEIHDFGKDQSSIAPAFVSRRQVRLLAAQLRHEAVDQVPDRYRLPGSRFRHAARPLQRRPRSFPPGNEASVGRAISMVNGPVIRPSLGRMAESRKAIIS